MSISTTPPNASLLGSERQVPHQYPPIPENNRISHNSTLTGLSPVIPGVGSSNLCNIAPSSTTVSSLVQDLKSIPSQPLKSYDNGFYANNLANYSEPLPNHISSSVTSSGLESSFPGAIGYSPPTNDYMRVKKAVTPNQISNVNIPNTYFENRSTNTNYFNSQPYHSNLQGQNGPAVVSVAQNSPYSNVQNGPSVTSAVLPSDFSKPHSYTQPADSQLRVSNMSTVRPQYQPISLPPSSHFQTFSQDLSQKQMFQGFGNNVTVPPRRVPLTGMDDQNPLLPLPLSSQKPITYQSALNAPVLSEPPSAKSSRNPSPIPEQRYDQMEGQFSSHRPTGPINSLQSPLVTSRSYPRVPETSLHSATPNLNKCPPVPSVPGTAGVINTTITSFNQLPVATSPMTSSPLISSAPGPVRPRYPQQIGYNETNIMTPASAGNTMPSQPYYPGQNLPEGPVGGVTGYDPNLHAKMAGMSVHSSFSRLWGNEGVNLLQDRNILPSVPIEPPRPVLPQERQNCNPELFRCTLTKIPESHALLQKSRLPLGILIHPFKDVKQLPVVQCGTIVRCRSCRTYINPFVIFVDQRRWKCNLCFRINDLPDEFLYDPVSRCSGDPTRRPEIKNATIEFIAPSEYMLRPPQPAVYLFVLDVSHSAVQTGYLSVFCNTLLEELDNLPGDARTQIGFITFDSSVHYYNLADGLNQPHMLVVSDIEDIFIPSPDNLLVNLQENKSLVQDLLNEFPRKFANNPDTNSALGAALQAGFKLMSPTGGRITVMQTCLPNIGPGALKTREDPNLRAGKDIAHLGPANDFYKKLSLDCSGQQIAVDLFLLSSQYADIATLSCISKYSAGSVLYYPCFHATQSPLQANRYKNDLHRYLTRKIGFEAVMRIRCTRGLSIHTFHGNFFVRSTDLLSLPNVCPDAGFAMQIAIEDNLTDSNTVCFQAAVLYTSSKGERRIRVHTLSLPVVTILSDVLGGADQQAIIGLLSKMAVDRSLSSSMSDARDALINACVDLLNSYKITLPATQTSGTLMVPISTRLMPLYVLGLLKHMAFRTGVSTKLDERVFAMEQMKTLPLHNLLIYVYPSLYPVHNLDDKNSLNEDGVIIPQPPLLQLSFEKIDRHGAYLLDTLNHMYLYVGRAVSDHFCASVLGVPNFSAIPFEPIQLPELTTTESEKMKSFVEWLLSQRPFHAPLTVIREDSKDRQSFLQYMIDDRTESLFSYYEFLQHLKQQVSK